MQKVSINGAYEAMQHQESQQKGLFGNCAPEKGRPATIFVQNTIDL